MTDSSPSALLSLGHVLSQARQAEGLSVGALAGRLNMGIEQLNALESGDLSKLPEPVFVIAQARRIAQSLGISIDAEIQALRQSEDFTPKAINLSELKFNPPKASGPDLPDTPSEPAAKRPAKPPAKSPATGNATPSNASGALRALASLALVCGIAAGATALWQQWQIQQQQQRLRQLAIARQAALVLQARQQLAARQAEAKALAQAKALQATSLTIRSASGTWLEVKTLRDQPLFRGEFRGQRPFPLAQGLKVLAGRPDLVQVQIGQAPSKPLGPITPVRWQTFAATQKRPPIGAQAPATTPTANAPAATRPKAPSKPPTKAATPQAKAQAPAITPAKQVKPNGASPATPSPAAPTAPAP